MTIYEHAMVGINGALALGLARRHGWQIVAWAGFAAVLPDLDGLTILLGLQCYAEGHRLWAHNLLVTGLAAAVLSAAAFYSDAPTRIQRWFAKYRCGRAAESTRRPCWGGSCTAAPRATADTELAVQPPAQRSVGELLLWIVVGVVAAYSHLLTDVLFSVGTNMPIWGVPLFWPFSDAAYAYPLVRWGDVGTTLILAASMFAMLRWPARLQAIAAVSLLAVAAYTAGRGFCL
jgi:membrane-bound metal-dependent hydrolase YbcI (DUF457 family)